MLPKSKNNFQSLNQMSVCKLQAEAWCVFVRQGAVCVCVCTLHDEAESKYLQEHILCAFSFWHCSSPGCEDYLDRPAGDCKQLNVYGFFSSYIQAVSSSSCTHTFLCGLMLLENFGCSGGFNSEINLFMWKSYTKHKSFRFYYTRLLSYNWLPEIVGLRKLSTRSEGQLAAVGQMRGCAEGCWRAAAWAPVLTGLSWRRRRRRRRESVL